MSEYLKATDSVETIDKTTLYHFSVMNNSLEMLGWGDGESAKSLSRQKASKSLLPFNISGIKISPAAIK